MSKQVDVKALVSHVIRGDGVNKCRICMGDTSEGQVHLSDTVVLEGDKPVTLSELLEIVTGIQVWEETELPGSLCSNCKDNALLAWNFRLLCQRSHQEWNRISTVLIEKIEDPRPEDTIYYICCNNKTTIFKDYVDKVYSLAEAAERLNIFANINNKKTQTVHKKKRTKQHIKSKCPICGKIFDLFYSLNHHLLMTTKRACTICGKILWKEKLQTHLGKIHRKFGYYCDICHQMFDDQCRYDEHKKLHGRSSLQCGICKHGFKNERSLRAHMYAHTLFSCSSCNTSFENRKCFVYHRKHCTGSKQSTEAEGIYECHDCGRTYTKKPSLRIHIVQKHLDVLPFICQICGKRSSTKNHHKSHELVHKTERKIYECHCGAKMTTALGFYMHQRIHSGEKPYKCDECGDSFISSSRRLDHIKRRHKIGKMTHVCNNCGAGFIRPFELKKHYRNVHPTQSYTDKKQEELLIPQHLCISCTHVATTAYEFRLFARNSQRLWSNCITSIESLFPIKTQKSFYTIIKENLLLQSVHNFEGSATELVDHLSNRFKKKPTIVEKKVRHPRTGPACDCIDCGKKFLSPYFLNIHLRNSAQKEACWLCGTMTIRGLPMKEHLWEVHKSDTFVCSECPLLFKSVNERMRHLKKCHGPGKLTCTDCGRYFYRKASFEVHMQMHAVRTCRACGDQFTNRGCYREHRAKCEPNAKPDPKSVPRCRRSNIRDPATFTCDYCGKTYHSRPQLKNHILWIHMDIRPHQCQWCGKRFYTSARLVEHTVVHTRVRNFECDICGAKLVSKMAAVYHRRRHTGEKPYECEDCGEKFISSSRRSEHAKRRHNKGSRFQCPHCHSSFVRSHELKKHIDKVHNPDNNPINPIVLKVKKESDLLKATA